MQFQNRGLGYYKKSIEKTSKMKTTITVLFFISGMLMSLAQESYTLSPESTLTIDGTSTIHDWTVTANTLEGKMNLDGDVLKEIVFEVTVTDIMSERGAAMDKKMHNALKKEAHPKVVFLVKEIDISEGESQEISGTISIAGVEKETSVLSNIARSDEKIHIAGEKKIKLQDYGMEPPTAMFGSIIVGDDVTVKFDLVFAKE